MLIYVFYNTISRKFYVGQTYKGLATRWHEHVRTANRGGGSIFHEAIRKYGAQSFVGCELQRVSTENELNAAERYWIRVFNSCSRSVGYNVRPGGNRGRITDPEMRKKIFGGRIVSRETRRRLSEANKGNVPPSYIAIPPETITAMIVNGKSADQIAQEFNCHRVVIYRTCRKYFGLSVNQLRKKLTGCSKTIEHRRRIAARLSDPKHPSFARKHRPESIEKMRAIKLAWWNMRKSGATTEINNA